MSALDILLNLSNELPGCETLSSILLFFSATSIILFNNN